MTQSTFQKNHLNAISIAIRARLKEVGLDQRAVASRSGLSVNSVRNVLAGGPGNISTYLAVLEVLAMNLDELHTKIVNNAETRTLISTSKNASSLPVKEALQPIST